jgi:hypothetical protein
MDSADICDVGKRTAGQALYHEGGGSGEGAASGGSVQHEVGMSSEIDVSYLTHMHRFCQWRW